MKTCLPSQTSWALVVVCHREELYNPAKISNFGKLYKNILYALFSLIKKVQMGQTETGKILHVMYKKFGIATHYIKRFKKALIIFSILKLIFQILIIKIVWNTNNTQKSFQQWCLASNDNQTRDNDWSES